MKQKHLFQIASIAIATGLFLATIDTYDSTPTTPVGVMEILRTMIILIGLWCFGYLSRGDD